MGEEGDGSMNHGDYGSQNTGAGSHIATTMAMGEEGHGSMNHGDYGSQNTGAGSHSTGGSSRCDLQYCGTTCLQYAYCADPTKQDVNCLNAPTDCAERCSGCAEVQAAVQGGGGGGGSAHGSHHGYGSHGSMSHGHTGSGGKDYPYGTGSMSYNTGSMD